MKQIEFKVGDIIEVTVANFAHFGVFCKCPNDYKGLAHVSNVSNSFVLNESFNIEKK